MLPVDGLLVAQPRVDRQPVGGGIHHHGIGLVHHRVHPGLCPEADGAVTDDLGALKFQLDRTPGNKTSALEVTGKVEVETHHGSPVDTRQVPDLRMSPELKAKLDAVLGPAPEPPVRQLPVPERSLGLDL